MVTAEALQGLALRAAARLVQAALEEAACPDADVDAAELVRFVAGQEVRFSAAVLNAEQAQRLAELTARRAGRQPLQYLLGRWPFLDFELTVGEGVLCPRSDTEIVAEAAAQALAGVTAPRVLDLCAGSGCLGLGVKRFIPSAQVTALEKSEAALPYLRQNAAHGLEGLLPAAPQGYAQVVQGDLFTYWQQLPEGELDAIVSNPPYLTAAEMNELQPEVQQEPAMALAAGEDGLDFYRAIAAHYRRALRPGGLLALEIGWQQRAAVAALLEQNGWAAVTCQKDYGGNDRCILARRPRE